MTLAKTEQDMSLLESVVVDGDLANLSSADRLSYYAKVCDSMGLNPLTKPFEYIRLQGKLILYAGRNCTDQLCNIRRISTTLGEGKVVDGVYLVRATATTWANELPTQRSQETEATGAVSIEGLKGEAKANAMMKAETKAKRRAVLSLVGLSMLDGTEVETIPDREAVVVDQATGEIMAPPERPKPAPQKPKEGDLTADLEALRRKAENEVQVQFSDPWERMEQYIAGKGLPWPNFEIQVLGMSQQEYVKQGGTPRTAYELYTKWASSEPSETDEPVTMDGLASP